MKRYLVFIAVLFLISANLIKTSAQDDVNTNENAPSNYDANLKKGDRAVGIVIGDLESFTIISKSNGIYLAAETNSGREYSFRANSVYPYFDIQQFGKIISGKEDLITPYLECYSKKRSLDFEQVRGDGFRPPDFGNADEMKEILQKQQVQLAQLETQLKTLASRPDTFLDYTKNPAVWFEIAAKRAEYLPCVLGDKATQDVAESPWLRAHRDGIKKVLGYVENYQIGSKDSMATDSEYAVYAVSPKERMEWLKEKNALQFKEPIEEMLKPLADVLARKLPSYPARMEKYPFGTAADFTLMKQIFSNPSRYKIFKIGLMQNVWQIDKNAIGIPNTRYKNGVIYLRDLQGDHPYCYATHVNIIQDYSGGGTYAASRAKYISDELVVCPAGN